MIFIGGLLCGYALTQVIGQRTDAPPQSPSARDNASAIAGDSNIVAPLAEGAPTTADLYDQILPLTSSAWVWVDLDRINQPNPRLEALMNEEPVARFFQQFASAMPQGATQAAGNLFAHSQSARIFSMPPTANDQAFPFLAAFTQPGVNLDDVHRMIREPFLQLQPELSVTEIEAGPYRLHVFETSVGEFGYLFDRGIIWTTNQAESFAQMLTVPAPDAQSQMTPHRQWLVEYPDVVAGLFLNAAGQGVEAMGQPGLVPQTLANMGVSRAAALLKFTGGEGRLTILAHAASAPDWVDEWTPVEEYMFRASDPAGMLELTMNWPMIAAQQPMGGGGERAARGGFAGGADGAIAFNPPEGFTPPAGFTPPEGFVPPGGFAPGAGEERGAAFRGEGARGPREGGARQGGAPEGFEGGAFMQGMQGMGGRQDRGGMGTFNIFNRLIPQGRDVGINFFGLQDTAPSMTIATPDLDQETSFVGRLTMMPMVENLPVEIAMLPGSRYVLSESPMARNLRLDELVVIERDAITYLFDAEQAARYYFENRSDNVVGERSLSADLRRMLEAVRTPAQIEGILTPDMLQWILELEKSRFSSSSAAYSELQELSESLKAYMQPMAFSAGFEDEHWFLEAITPEDAGMTVDLAILLLGISRWLYGA